MDYKLLYIEDQSAESRESDLKDLGYIVNTLDPPKDLGEILSKIKPDTNALILDYRLTKGENNVCFDAPTIAQTLRSKHSENKFELPIILMSNENVITDYYKDFTSQDLFDFSLTKKEFIDDKIGFNKKLKSFIGTYSKIKEADFNLSKILDVEEEGNDLIHSRIFAKLDIKKGDIFAFSDFIYSKIICSTGLLIDEDVLSARIGISKKSSEWKNILDSLNNCVYGGIFSDTYPRWWMSKIENWWVETIQCETPLRRLDASERMEIIKNKLSLTELEVVVKTTQSHSSNFWTVCKYSNAPLDPFDGIELLKEYLPWQEKEYLSIDSALIKMDDYKNLLSAVDKKAIRELAHKLNTHG